MEDSISSKINNIPNVKHIFRGKKLGRGSAVLEGFTSLIKNSKADVFVEMDADYSHNPNELKENLILFNEKKLDLLISSRYLKGRKLLIGHYLEEFFLFLQIS